jgi:hypothetical protein
MRSSDSLPVSDPLEVGDCDLERGIISITKARVLGREKDRTKTREDRDIRLCGRALDVLNRQLVLREQLVREGTIDHDFVFFQEDGRPIMNLSYPYDRWRYVLDAYRRRSPRPPTWLTVAAALLGSTNRWVKTRGLHHCHRDAIADHLHVVLDSVNDTRAADFRGRDRPEPFPPRHIFKASI